MALVSLTVRSAEAAAPADASRPAVDVKSYPAHAEVHRTLGFSMDFGVPDGAALGMVVRPAFNWLRLEAAATFNGAAPGARLGLTLDPVPWVLAPTLTAEGGHTWDGPVPGMQNSPSVGYDYANFHFGLEFGHRESLRFFLRGGASWVDVHTANFHEGAGSGVVAQNPSFIGWVAPTAKLGFAQFF